MAFAGRYFGATYYAQPGGPSQRPVPPFARFGVGGSGFPKDWLERMRGLLRPLPGEELDRELAELLATGLLD